MKGSGDLPISFPSTCWVAFHHAGPPVELDISVRTLKDPPLRLMHVLCFKDSPYPVTDCHCPQDQPGGVAEAGKGRASRADAAATAVINPIVRAFNMSSSDVGCPAHKLQIWCFLLHFHGSCRWLRRYCQIGAFAAYDTDRERD
jgi:hypothetical protein